MYESPTSNHTWNWRNNAQVHTRSGFFFLFVSKPTSSKLSYVYNFCIWIIARANLYSFFFFFYFVLLPATINAGTNFVEQFDTLLCLKNTYIFKICATTSVLILFFFADCCKLMWGSNKSTFTWWPQRNKDYHNWKTKNCESIGKLSKNFTCDFLLCYTFM